MPLTHLFEGFAQELPEDVTFVGPELADGDGVPPRISWKPYSAQHTKPTRLSAGAGDEGDIWLREVLIFVRIWGNDLDQAEELLGIFANVAERLLSKWSYRLNGEQWSRPGEPSNGIEVGVNLILRVPIKRKAKRVVTLTEIVPHPHIKHPEEE